MNKTMSFLLLFLLLLFSPLFAQCEVSIDSVWFFEEDTCDNRNIVQICYILSSDCPDSEFTVSVQMSGDSGLTWTVPLDSLWDEEGDIGEGVLPDTHCFFWEMGYDLPDTEGYDWMVEAAVVSFLDTFLVIDSVDISSRYQFGHGLAYGDGYYWIYDNELGWIYKTYSISYSAIDSFFIGLEHNCDIDYYGGYLYYAKSGSVPTTIYRMNIITRFEESIATLPSINMGIQGLQVIGDALIVGYYAWNMEILSYDLTSPFPISTYTTLITEPHSDCHTIEGLAYAYGFLWGCNNNRRIAQIDLSIPDYVGCYPVPGIGYGAEGLCWDGQYLWYHNFSTENIYQILISDTLVRTDTAFAPLDSRPPSVIISCPTIVSAGEAYTFEWSVEDLFWINQPCSLHIFGCGIDEHYVAMDTFFAWTPPTGCESCTLVVAARDSFCNWDYDTCFFEIEEAACTVSIDSVWFFEETDCDDRNIVEICYILSTDCPDSGFTVSVRMSGDGGETWDVPLDSLWDAEGDIGDGVLPDTHCFFWELGYDLPDSEGYDWMVEVGVPIVAETFEIIDSMETGGTNGTGLAYGGGYYWSYEYSTGNIFQYEYITETPIDTFYIGTSFNTDLAYIDSCIYYGRSSTYPPDVYRYNIRTSLSEIVCDDCCDGNGAQGLATDGNYLYVTTGSETIGRYIIKIDISSIPLISIDTVINIPNDTSCVDGMAYTGEGPCGGIWGVNGHGYIVQYSLVTGALKSIHRVPYSPFGSIGVEGMCWDGEYLWYVDTDLDKMYKIDICTSEGLSVSALAPLDSRPPEVHLACPGDSVIMLGDTMHLSWTIDDLFWDDDPCTLRINWCFGETTIAVDGTEYDWVIPFEASGCDTLRFWVSARDSFCNWGSDSCSIPPICRPAWAWIICAPCGGYTGCFDQTVQWEIIDLDGFDIALDSTFYTIVIYHSDLTSDTLHLSGASDSLSFDCAPSGCDTVTVTLSGFTFDSGDWVIVTFDSLFNSHGCFTIPGE